METWEVQELARADTAPPDCWSPHRARVASWTEWCNHQGWEWGGKGVSGNQTIFCISGLWESVYISQCLKDAVRIRSGILCGTHFSTFLLHLPSTVKIQSWLEKKWAISNGPKVNCTASLVGMGLLSSLWKHSLESCFTVGSPEAMDIKIKETWARYFCFRFVYKSDLTWWQAA